jgi:rhodanese-related sulfurtransferase
MPEILRVAPQEARESVASGRAILVCAYDSDQKFRAMRLEGAIPLTELMSRLPSLGKDQEIVCYCA